MSDIVQAIMDAATMDKPWTWQPDHPQYIEGRLYLTPEQWQAVLDQSPEPQPGDNQAQAAWGIPVEIIHPDKPIKLQSGRTLLYLPRITEALLVCDPPPWVKYGPAGPGVTQVGPTRL